MRFLGSIKTLLLLLLGFTLLAMQICIAFPAPNIEKIREPESGDGGSRPSSPERGHRGVCENKGKICEVICKNNPSEGGKFCNCDTYALRAKHPSFADCNRLI